jgi:hypothetical protein
MNKFINFLMICCFCLFHINKIEKYLYFVFFKLFKIHIPGNKNVLKITKFGVCLGCVDKGLQIIIIENLKSDPPKSKPFSCHISQGQS